jgi:hypothetical protein
MKTKFLILSGILFLSTGCSNIGDLFNENNAANAEINENSDISLEDTQWKLSGITDVETNEIKALEPKDCEDCYTLKFESDSIAIGKSSSNGVYVELLNANSLRIGTMTEIAERGDGNLFSDIINQEIESYLLEDYKLKIFYNEGKNYLLYEPIKKGNGNNTESKQENNTTYKILQVLDNEPVIVRKHILTQEEMDRYGIVDSFAFELQPQWYMGTSLSMFVIPCIRIPDEYRMEGISVTISGNITDRLAGHSEPNMRFRPDNIIELKSIK